MSDFITEKFGPAPTWMDPAAPCLPTAGSTPLQIRDHTDQWHPATAYGPQQARELCRGCPALNACLTANLHEPDGIWGGTTPHQRKWLRGKSAA